MGDILNANKNAEKELQLCITALRLLHNGNVSPFSVIVKDGPLDDECATLFTGFNPDYKSPESLDFDSNYKFKEKNIDKLRNIYLKLKYLDDINMLNKIELGIRRFNLSYSSYCEDDVILNLTIALESILLNNIGDKRELNYRFALRGAALLSRHRNPHEVFKTLKSLYVTRSQLVHDGKRLVDIKNNGLKDVKSYLSTIEEITREIYIEYLNRINSNNSPEEINKELDYYIINSLKYEAK